MRAPASTTRQLASAAAVLLACVGCAGPRGTAERPAVMSLEIRGADAIEADDIKEKLATQASDPWWKLFWRGAAYFDEDAFANDRRRVTRLYQANGYYDAKLAEAAVVPAGDGRVDVRMRVEEGPPTKVVELRIDGVDDAPELRAKLGKLPLRQGERFTEAEYDATQAAIALALGASGYPKGEVTQRAHIDPARHEARVVYTVDTGQRYRFGNVFVSGTSAIPRARVRQEAERVFKPGEWFETPELEKVQGRIFDLGVFGGVRVAQGPPDEKGPSIPVVVSVREAPFRTLRAGPGLGIELNRWDVSLIAGWRHRNWLGDLRKLSFDARLGYAFLPTPFAPSKQGFVGLVSADFTQPGAIRQRLDVNTRVELERGLEEGYDFWAERFKVGAPFKYQAVSFTPSYNIELYQITGTIEQDPGATENLLLQNCTGSACLLSFFEQRIALDLRDDPINPRRGLYLSFAIQEGFKIGAYGFPYIRLLPEVRGFLPVLRQTVLGARLRLGALQSLNASEPPVVARFYSGGPNLMRGYYTRRLSPLALDEGDFVPVGGTGLLDGSVEARIALTRKLGAAVFLDYGIVTENQADAFNPGNLQYAVGLGLRYLTIFGPIRVDVAGRLPRRTSSGWVMPSLPVVNADPGTVHSEPIVSVHLSLGEAF
jgi:translocation and assembly module TamA